MRNIDRLLYLIRAEPTLCPPVRGDADPELLMRHRAHDEVHGCLACDAPADAALIVETDAGWRWLDVCWDHYLGFAAPDPERLDHE